MIVAIDPGGATGIATFTTVGVLRTSTVEGGFEGMSDHLAAWPWSWLEAVVIENFVPRPGAKSMQLDALHIIGAVRHECRKHSVPLILQTPSQAKSFATNEKLKAVGWYTVGADHERDAARHMLVYLCKRGITPEAYNSIQDQILGTLGAM